MLKRGVTAVTGMHKCTCNASEHPQTAAAVFGGADAGSTLQVSGLRSPPHVALYIYFKVYEKKKKRKQMQGQKPKESKRPAGGKLQRE